MGHFAAGINIKKDFLTRASTCTDLQDSSFFASAIFAVDQIDALLPMLPIFASCWWFTGTGRGVDASGSLAALDADGG